MPEDISPPSQPTGRFESVLAEILQAEEEGRTIDVQRYCESFPDLTERLREYFRDREHFARVAPVLAPTPAPQAAEQRADPEAETTPHYSSPPASSAGALPKLNSHFAGYEIEAELGRGGMGIVYRARQLKPERRVALKIIRMDRLESLPVAERRQWLERFQREAQLVASLDQPDHIVTLYEVGEQAGQSYFTMRLVTGGTLAQRLKQINGPDETAAEQRVHQQRDHARLLATVARAVHYAHQRGILHRDLKPANILLDEQGRPLVSDFGLARRVDQSGSLVACGIEGTAEYMSPEQAAAAPGAATTAADVYGLGAILYECLTGRPPFKGNNDVETLLLVLHQDVTPPRRLNRRLDRDLETICLKCLQKEPNRRYASASALADDLDNWLAGRTINARQANTIERAWRWCRRNPWLAGAAATVAATVLIAFVLIYQALQDTRQSARDADVARNEAVQLANEKGTLAEEKSRLADEKGRLAVEKENEATRANTEASQAKLRAYFLSMMLSRREWLTGNVAAAEKLLDECPASLRHWEWGYLKQLCNADLLTLEGHASAVCAVAFEPSGRRLASAGMDGTLVLWDLATGKKLETLRGHTGSVL
ncbi:MAG TPA: serine/threonine-protein kinase, partial [Gemmataceae bacterium]